MNIDAFLKTEKKYNLNKLEINGVNYWTYNRFHIWNYGICSEKLGLEEAHDKEKVSFSKALKFFLSATFKSQKITSKDVLVLNHNRRVFNGSTYDCIYTDDIFKDSDRAVFLEAPYRFSHLKPATSKEIIYTDKIVVRSFLRSKSFRTFHKKEYNEIVKKIEEQLTDAVTDLKNEYGWSASVESVARRCAETVIRYDVEKKMYSDIIKKVNPKAIIEVVHYISSCMMVNEIAKELNIPTVELQHGTMYRDHAAYQYEEGEKIKQLPDKIFVFSDFWKNCVSLPIDDENLVVTGFPNFEKKLNLYGNAERKDERKTIIFISQGTIGKYLSSFAAELSKALDSKEYRMIYKLHPAEYSTWREEMPGLIDSEIEVIDRRDIDLYSLFAQSDIQIGAYSTAIFEGMGFGLKTFIYKTGHYDIMLPLIEQGYAELVTNVDECIEKINDTQLKKVDASLFWKRNALENIREEIDSIVKSEG